MSSIDSSVDDHAYFQAIEEAFIRLRGAPLLLSPADWQLAREWSRRGIPLELVLATLERVFERRAARGAVGRIQGLRYCSQAVERAWSEQQELQAAGKRRPIGALDIPATLQALASSLPDSLADRQEVAARIRRLEGPAEEIEAALLELDREILASAATALDEVTRREIESEVAEAQTRLGNRIDEDELQWIEERLWMRAMRRRLGLPVLSLFSLSPGDGS